MTTRSTAFLLLTTILLAGSVCLVSCSVNETAQSDLEGTIVNDQFKSKVLTVDITDGWTQGTDSTEGQFLMLSKYDSVWEGTISFLGFKKSLGDKMFYSKEDVSRKILEGVKADNEQLQPVYENKSLTIDEVDFLVSKFTFNSGSKAFQMIYYVAETKDFFLSFVFMDDTLNGETEINKVIESIKFID